MVSLWKKDDEILCLAIEEAVKSSRTQLCLLLSGLDFQVVQGTEFFDQVLRVRILGTWECLASEERMVALRIKC